MAQCEPIFSLDNGSGMPLVGLGTWQTDNLESVYRALEAAVDAGYRLIDTAVTYKNESLIGQSLRKLFDCGRIRRQDVFITTKLPQNGLKKDSVEYFLRLSLSALQLEYMDLYLIHFPVATKRTENDDEVFPFEGGELQTEIVDLTETWKAMESLVDKGLVKSIGLSNFNSVQVQRIYDSARIKPSNLQVECHAYLGQYELFEFCKELGISFTAYSPLGTPGLPDFVSKNYNFNYEPEKLLDDVRVKELASRYKKTTAQILLRFLVQRGITVIPKSSDPGRIRENIEIFDFCLEEEDMQILKSMNKNFRYFTFDFHKNMKEHPEYPFNIPF